MIVTVMIIVTVIHHDIIIVIIIITIITGFLLKVTKCTTRTPYRKNNLGKFCPQQNESPSLEYPWAIERKTLSTYRCLGGYFTQLFSLERM